MVRGIGFLTIKEIHFHGHVITVQLSILVDHMIPDVPTGYFSEIFLRRGSRTGSIRKNYS